MQCKCKVAKCIWCFAMMINDETWEQSHYRKTSHSIYLSIPPYRIFAFMVVVETLLVEALGFLNTVFKTTYFTITIHSLCWKYLELLNRVAHALRLPKTHDGAQLSRQVADGVVYNFTNRGAKGEGLAGKMINNRTVSTTQNGILAMHFTFFDLTARDDDESMRVRDWPLTWRDGDTVNEWSFLIKHSFSLRFLPSFLLSSKCRHVIVRIYPSPIPA